ncbi:PREDICTED: two-component response regulator-like APRR5 isoform X2 [Ipomoea nil]|uniref:two-component response regulator-like APRR5 isoform X2 n=1 Tax=Ipomoea nil TaxID=35883 RepID=UPI0009010C0E|nr:PREDICTED: two-component response regulator-like APRR5 isoform X2 [Ipomoea nil]
MVLRVLLVEADDSTRQIIAALLRKCSYRVAAVPDGLKAWEVLKERPSNVDLILTEVELPSISGYALLTLIMEHEICKNIPVIMMSSNDSVSMVYKCMLRGAADFLVKPVRKNELRNLWQHVWRRQAANRIDNLNGPVSPTRNEDCSEKGSDDQNSCVKLEMEVGGENTENVEESEERFRGVPIHPDVQKQEQEDHNQDDDEDDPAYLKSSKRAINLIGAFDNSPKCDYRSSCSKDSAEKVESLPPLDLSLTRYPPSGSPNRLNHSDASAFTRYINKVVQPRNSMAPKTSNQQDDCGTDSDKHTLGGPTMNFHALMRQARAEPGNNEIGLPIPVRGVGFKGLGNAHTSMQSPGSAGCQDSRFQTPLFHLLNHEAVSYQNTDNDTSQSEKKEENQSEPADDHGHFSSFTDQSANSSTCNGKTSVPLVKSTVECSKEKAPLGQDGSYQQSQREAALTKFRLKRKDRCFEKKVRYESRKKLAEQRPRVKGQFVRQQPK